MPTFQITGPDGKKYRIKGENAEGALRALQKHLGQSSEPMPQQSGDMPSIGEDVAKSGAAGLAEGGISLAGLAGDAASMNERIFRGGAEMLGAPEWLADAAGTAGRWTMGPLRNAPTSEQIAAPIKEVTGEFYQPQTGWGQAAHTAGVLAPGALLGPGGALARIGALTGGTAGAEGAAYLTPDEYDPYARALGGVIGGGVGAGGVEAATMRPPEGLTRGAAGILRQSLPDDNFANYQRLGPEARVLDAGPSTVALAQGVARTPGQSADEIINMVTTRDRGRSNRLLADTQSTLGRASDPERLKREIQEAAQRKAGPIYKDAVKNAPQLPESLGQILGVDLQQAIAGLPEGKRMAFMKVFNEIEDALVPSANGPDPAVTASRLWNIRQDLDSKIVWDRRTFEGLSSAEKTLQSVYKDSRDMVDEVLKNRIPGFDVADPIIAKSKKAADDIDYGYNSLEGGKSAIFPDTMARDLKKRDVKMVREGAKSRIANAMGTQANDLSALRKQIGGDNDFNRTKLEQLFGGKAVDDLVGRVDAETQMARNYADIDRNSQTARRQAAGRLVDGPDAPRVDTSASITGLALRGVEKAVNAITRRAVGNMSDRNKAAIAKALLKQGDEGLRLMQQLQTMPQPRAAAIVQALLAGGSIANAQAGR